ncbi:hypothetical protein WICPIJ_001382 [Wickerhamomyces pijperi]|uniref:Uncharacterized protein n=1 Tax=Wickerhamomyces pijperi TaxID=599730 RepID=A0A9P8QDQ8_WICPI|nr:hypothetical protein WICPIJ_001382 [Wickerhamomyces pijperi]
MSSSNSEKRRSILFPFRSITSTVNGSSSSKSSSSQPKFEVMNRKKLIDNSTKSSPNTGASSTARTATPTAVSQTKPAPPVTPIKNHIPSVPVTKAASPSPVKPHSSITPLSQQHDYSSSSLSFKHTSNAPLTITGNIPPVPAYHHFQPTQFNKGSPTVQRSGTVMTRKAPPGYSMDKKVDTGVSKPAALEETKESEVGDEPADDKASGLLQRPQLNTEPSFVDSFVESVSGSLTGGNSKSELFYDADDVKPTASTADLSKEEEKQEDTEEEKHVVMPLRYHKRTTSTVSELSTGTSTDPTNSHLRNLSISEELINDIDNYHLDQEEEHVSASEPQTQKKGHKKHKSISDEILQDIQDFESSLPQHREDFYYSESDDEPQQEEHSKVQHNSKHAYQFPSSRSYTDLHEQLDSRGSNIIEPPRLNTTLLSAGHDRFGDDDLEDGVSPVTPLQFRDELDQSDLSSAQLGEIGRSESEFSRDGDDNVRDYDSMVGEVHEDQQQLHVNPDPHNYEFQEDETTERYNDVQSVDSSMYPDSFNYSQQQHQQQITDNSSSIDPAESFNFETERAGNSEIPGSFAMAPAGVHDSDLDSFDFEPRGQGDQIQGQDTDYEDFRQAYAHEREMEQQRSISSRERNLTGGGLRIVNDGNYSDSASEEQRFKRQSVESGVLVDQSPHSRSPMINVVSTFIENERDEDDQSEEILSFTAATSPPPSLHPPGHVLPNKPSFVRSLSGSPAPDIPQVYAPSDSLQGQATIQSEDLSIDPLQDTRAMTASYHGHNRRPPPLNLEPMNLEPKMQEPLITQPSKPQHKHIPQRSPYVETLRLTAATANTRVSSSVWGLPIGIVGVNESLRRNQGYYKSQSHSVVGYGNSTPGAGSGGGGVRVTKIDLKHGKIKPRLLASEVEDEEEESAASSLQNSSQLERLKTAGSSINTNLRLMHTMTSQSLGNTPGLQGEAMGMDVPGLPSSDINRTGTINLKANSNYINNVGSLIRNGSVIEPYTSRSSGRGLFIANPDALDSDSD